MYIKELALKNFRNYKNLVLQFSHGINFIAGSNAAGKSNILESISVLSNIKSFRNVSDLEIIKWGEDSYFCSLILENNPSIKFEIGCSYLLNKVHKKAKIDGITKKKISDYYGQFLTVIFSPEDIALINGPPETRRKFFDAIISKVDINYLSNLTEYKRILASRNKLLRDIKEKKTKISGLDIWDNMFAERAEFILKKRIEFLNLFNSYFRDYSLLISGNEDSPFIKYNSMLNRQDKNNIVIELIEEREKDIIFGSTGKGPHRDDYDLFFKEGKIFKNCASQGQKRTAVISLKIAECKFIEHETNKKTVILIDDIFGELDENRRHRMMDTIKDSNQIIITAVNPDMVQTDNSADVLKFLVKPGSIVERI